MPDVSFPSRTGAGWRPGDDPLVVAEAIDLAATRAARLIAPLAVARRAIRNDIVERFESETDPEGNAWEAWADSYQDRAERENESILVKQSGYHQGEGPRLIDAVQDLNTYEIRSRGVSSAAIGGGSVALVGSNLPDYWIYHQEGTGKMPARPFIGISDEGEATIAEIFDIHFDDALAGAVTKTGQPIIRTERGPRFTSFLG